MNNLISKSQSLFLVAILAIFPSANAFSTEEAQQIDEEINRLYQNVNNKIKKLKNAEKATKETIKAKGGVSQLSLILMIAAPIILTIIVTYISTFINILK